jgi:hypothetical protein
MPDPERESFLRLTVNTLDTIRRNFAECFQEMANGGATVQWGTENSWIYFVSSARSRSEPFRPSVDGPDPIEDAQMARIGCLVRRRVRPEQFPPLRLR